MTNIFTPDLIASCGMNCGICKAYLAYSWGVPYKKGEVSHCSGCLARNKNCAFIKRDCEKFRRKQIRFCFECADMPCKNLANIDEHYSARYGMSMVENQKTIQEKGMSEFLKSQAEKYRCPTCGDVVSVHDGKCYFVAIKQTNRKATILSGGGSPTENRLAVMCNISISIYRL